MAGDSDFRQRPPTYRANQTKEIMMFKPVLLAAALAALPATAQNVAEDPPGEIAGTITRTSDLTGEMSVKMPADALDDAVTEVLRFEPWQMLDDLFRDDIVLLMRHGPTDWSVRDQSDGAPDDCENQRVMTELGKRQIRDLGTLMVVNDLIPGKVVVSQWCRNQQTFEALRSGMMRAEETALTSTAIETSADLNLLLSLQGAPNVTNLRNLVSSWDGSEAGGPLLIITHYTNIEELTQFNIYEGEMLVIDPKRNNRVLGYLRLKSAGPDVGHFDVEETEADYDPAAN